VQTSSAYFQTFKIFLFITVICLASFYLLSSVLIPVIVSFTIYALFEPAVNYLIRRNFNQNLAIILILSMSVFLGLLWLAFAVPKLVQQFALLQNKLPAILTKLEAFINVYLLQLSELIGTEIKLSELMLPILSKSSSAGQMVFLTISDAVLALTMSLILVPFITYFIFKDYKSLRNSLLNWLPNSSFELGWLIYHRVTFQLQAYTRGVMLQSLIMAIVTSIGFAIVGLDIPVLLGILTGLLNLTPYVGPIIAIVLSLLVAAAMTPFDPSLLYLVVMVIVAAQIIDNVIVIPAVIANAVDLHPLQVILGIIIFGNLFGMIGVILAVPAIAAARIIHTNLYLDIRNASR